VETITGARLGRSLWAGLAVVSLATVDSGRAQSADRERRELSVSARRFTFTPARLEVRQNDLVKITLQSADIPHSFTIDAYRIAKRVAGGQTLIFEFRADKPGTFPFYCSLDLEDGCKKMRGELIVRPR
jgi:cytochrome c oxidase subunit 2